ncbi:hypothetical protein [Nocardia cyriacigeorgica]|nr:hypothetical protein [Nocardia cyriacigeorgica]
MDELSRGANFRTEQEYNNLEVFDDTGRLIAAYAGDQWIAAVIVDGS